MRAVIDGIAEHKGYQLRAGERYEVVFDHAEMSAGDETVLHFRLAELHAPEQITSGRITVGGLGGAGPRMEISPADPVGHLAELLARLIELARVHPRVLGIPDGDGSLPVRIERYLRG